VEYPKQPGMVIIQPGTIKTHRCFRAFAVLLETSKDEPGITLRDEDAIQFYFRTADFPGTLYLPSETPQLTSESPAQIEVEMSASVALEPGLRFAIRRAGKTIRCRVVSEIVE